MSYLIFCSFEVGGLPYKIAQTLNKHGVEAYFISLSPDAVDHNSKKFHFGNIVEPWDLTLSVMEKPFLSQRNLVARLNSIKKRFNVSKCFATGSKAMLLQKSGMEYKYWVFGSDLDQNCFKPVWPANYPVWKKALISIYFNITTRNDSRKSIRAAESVMIAPYQLESLNKIFPQKKLYFLPHLIDVLDYEELLRQKSIARRAICEELDASHFFFSSTRHFWHGEHNKLSDNKGNDLVLRSFARFIEISKRHDIKLVLIAKGPDVDASKNLARELGIERQTVWLGEMRRDELDKYYQAASICFGQFGTPVITYSVLEPLQNATVCVSYFEATDLKVPFYNEMPPVFNCKDPDVIAKFLIRIMSSGEHLEELSKQSWNWIKNNCSEEIFVNEFLKSI